MGIFDTEIMLENEEEEQMRNLTEHMIVMDLQSLPSDILQEFCQSEEAQALVEAKVLNKPTLIRLSKKDDLSRRNKLAAFEICKKQNPALWNKLVQNRVKEKQLINKIVQMYGGARSNTLARKSQQEYIKSMKSVKLPKNFGGSVR